MTCSCLLQIGIAFLCMALEHTTVADDSRTLRKMDITVLSSNLNQCPSQQEMDTAKVNIRQRVLALLANESCGGSGWRQIAFVDMTDANQNCPPGLSLTSYSKRTCGRAHSNAQTCSSTTFNVGGSAYSRVCGRIGGYQVGETSAFFGYLQFSQSLEGWYVDGVSLTHGAPGTRQHIWTYAAGYTDLDDNQYPLEQCPCDVSNTRVISPTFVGNDYFCESAAHVAWSGWFGVFFPGDPLWNGQGCASTSTCCQFNNPPWFTKFLPNPTTDAIELRICTQRSGTDEDTALERIELYVQ